MQFRYGLSLPSSFGRDPFFRFLSRFLIVSALAIAASLFSRRMFEGVS